MDDASRLDLIVEAVLYCQRMRKMGMPVSSYTKALREPIYFLWERRAGKNKAACAQFRSKAATGMRFGGRTLIYDHAVPFTYLQTELLDLEVVNRNSVRALLDKHSVVVLITTVENALLDKAGFGRKMPKDWDGVDPLARYKAVGIQVLPNL